MNLHLLLIFLICMVPHFGARGWGGGGGGGGVSENNHLFCGFLKKMSQMPNVCGG